MEGHFSILFFLIFFFALQHISNEFDGRAHYQIYTFFFFIVLTPVSDTMVDDAKSIMSKTFKVNAV